MMAATPLSVPLVEEILHSYDEDLELVPQNISEPGYHPVLFMFNNMTNLKTVPVDILFGLCDQYYEYIVIIPYIKSSKSDKVRSVSTILYLNNAVAVVGGNMFYGMPKKFEDVEMSEFTFKVMDHKTSQELINMVYKKGKESFTSDYMENYDTYNLIVSIFQQEGIQRYRDTYLCYHFVFDWNNAVFSQASYQFETSDDAIPGVESIHVESNSFMVDANSVYGSFYVDANW
eukprot:CAMPEP_0185017672 /NCGR_PEP_ID=MMETSP1103-20130426/596_1 /TAXON_ID=36769 /ORGANISM="Paraphysomonas bandaiensis, Strain Caron Lab Isolate" /LENGTH=230 /DNA_ID=CAMNT_0027547193 /DNA_START=178 /DNA_END=867 /DNA_ORIENTATION=+